MPNNSFRAFFAIDIPEDIKKAIIIAIKPLLSHYTAQQIKWVKEKNLHITLCFLGNISEQQYQCIDKKIKDVIKAIKKFSIELTTPQPFPSAENFHIVSLKSEASTALNSLTLAIKNSVATCGIQTEDRPFCPHLTLGRINDRHKIDGEILRTIKLPAMSFEVSAIKLFKSEPRPAGSVYTVVATYDFL